MCSMTSSSELPPIILQGKQLIKYRHLKRKYPVSRDFLHRNWWNVKRFIIYALTPRCVLRNYAWRRRRNNRVVIRKRVRICLFDPRLKRMIKRRKKNIRKWSVSIVNHHKKMGHIEEYEETELYNVAEPLPAAELSKQMKQQLELLKTGKRTLCLIEDTNKNFDMLDAKAYGAIAERIGEDNGQSECSEPMDIPPAKATDERTPTKSPESMFAGQEDAPTPATPSKENTSQASACSSAEKAEKSEKSGGSKFLDMLINKVRVKTFARESNLPIETCPTPAFTAEEDGSGDFVGFDESVHQPGMLLTPIVPQSCKTLEGNSAFVSESLDAYMREHHINDDKEKLLEPMGHDGQVTSHSLPPPMDMPAVPEALQRLRTVAERRSYLLRSKNQKMAIINNEANIYRELQRKQRQRKVKIGAMQLLQSSSTQMPFTRQGWQAASYVATEMSKYYYQVIQVDGERVRLPGAQGNNLQREKLPYLSKLTVQEAATVGCTDLCLDASIHPKLNIVRTTATNAMNHKRLNQFPLSAIFPPCPLSMKPLQKPLDDDTAALLLAGGSMAVVSMPTVQLEVMPLLGRPLDEIAKRYLQHILPHHDITREWAEFSLSTLQQQPPVCMKEAEQQASQTAAGRRKSFTFVIPYINDRNHILVRRVVDRSEQMDSSFYQEPHKLQEFAFRKALPQQPDADLLDCADMINDMINTVAISCSENSFISEDKLTMDDRASVSSPPKPAVDLNLVKEEDDKSSGKWKCRPTKQKRLANELRRLNATIIDAAARNADAKTPCRKDHCQLGCLCASLSGAELPMRDHCGRADCVLECHCLGGEQARVMRVQTADGRSISNEDAFNLRRKATARLAKMEKDFTSTLVLTDNETLLINESQGDKKRRCTKAPKRYEDFDDSNMFDDDDELVSPSRSTLKRNAAIAAATAAAAAAAASAAAAANAKSAAAALTKSCKVRDTDLAKLKHCSVSIRRLPDMGNLATFCMIHQLYKCFCGGESIEGKPVVIEKEQWNATVSHYNPELATRAHYSFERPPEEQPKKRGRKKQNQTELEVAEKEMAEAEPPPLPPQQKLEGMLVTRPKVVVTTKSPKNVRKEECAPKVAATSTPAAASVHPARLSSPHERSVELDNIYAYYISRPYLCRRAVSVPRRSYTRRNRCRVNSTREYINSTETPQTQELLKRRIDGAVFFYRKELEKQRRRQLMLQGQAQDVAAAPVIVVRDDSDESEQTGSRKRNVPSGRQDVQSRAPQQAHQTTSRQGPWRWQASPGIQVPRIAACYSLNSASVDVLGSGMNTAAAAAAAASGVGPSTAEADSPNFRSFYNEVVKNMNTLVSKKMQDIDLALQRESKIIPAPNEEILCIIKWTNFLAAFESNYVYIWIVQMKTYTFLAATTTNLMPTVCGAIAIGDTRFAPATPDTPMMARMLMESKRNEYTSRLAVVMQGRQSYWLVKGFLRHMQGSACTKPTPQTHPLLTKKINVLCSLLVKQRIREHQKKLASPDAGQPAKSPSPANTIVPEEQSESVAVVMAVSVAAPEADCVPEPRPAFSNQALSKANAANIRTNIEFRKVTRNDVDELDIPESYQGDHRWVVLDLVDDFSHIFVPAFGEMISLDRIHKMMRVARDKKKLVKLQFFHMAPYDAFVTASSLKKIYFGPLRLDMSPPVLVLLQSVDGKMMLREVYQREHSIPVQPHHRSMAFWVLKIQGQLHFEIDLEDQKTLTDSNATQITLPPVDNLVPAPGNASKHSVPANDLAVVIIDSDDEDEEVLAKDDKGKGQSESEKPMETETAPQPVGESLPVPDTEKIEELPRMNFTIQTMPISGALQITPESCPKEAPDAGPESSRPGINDSNWQPTGPFLPFIANVPAIGDLAPTTQFLTPQVQLTQTAAGAPSSSEPSIVSSLDPPAPKVGRFSFGARINESLQELLSSGTPTASLPASITVTKMDGNESKGTSKSPGKASQEAIKIGAKRSVSGVPKHLPRLLPKPTPASKEKPGTGTATATPASVTPMAGPTIAQQSATTFSISNLQPIRPRPAPPVGPATARAGTCVKMFSRGGPSTANKGVVRATVPEKAPISAAAVEGERVDKPAQRSQPHYTSLPLPVGCPAASLCLANTASTEQARSRQSLPAKVPTAQNATQTEGAAAQCTYGYVESEGLPRYRTKLSGDDFFLKMPNVGILRFTNCATASAYLNRELMRRSEHKSLLPADWKFRPDPQSIVRQTLAAKVSSKEQQPPAAIEIED
ncbi:LOW QUALITY PROTEIN: uncharacterized protein LOC111078985 [Drosophila obscura]|uniref:LOW QUALITY PROTEIN: uncharacterized protein LOC111078985 n=1 Tax=Drosophila obscura TaxID=7282 RepID=UPI001BB1EE54|nr:LOW QUALITY PROTEIN: uncharacterized protein LOC111078985 [Drosophila obscura]